MTKYTITTKTALELSELNSMDEDLFAKLGGRTFPGFELITAGMYTGDYSGMVDGEEAIFLADEVALAVAE